MKLAEQLLEELNIDMGGNFESATLRIHRYDGALQVTEVVNAGKRGKTCKRMSIEFNRSSPADIDNFLYMVTDKASFDELAEIAKSEKAEEYVKAVHAERELKGVEVIPNGFKKFEFSNDNFYIRAEMDSFSIRDLTDRNNDPTCISTDGSKAQVKKFYLWLRDNSDELKDLTFSKISDIAHKMGVKTHYYCAMD